MKKTSFAKKLLSVVMTLFMLSSIFTVGMGGIVAEAREQGISGGAEGFIPFKIYQKDAVTNTTNVKTALVVQVTDASYQLKINSIEVTSVSNDYSLNVAYSKGYVVKASNGAEQFEVTGTIANTVNSPVRYELSYDLLDTKGNVVWSNLTAFTYGTISAYAPVADGVQGNYLGVPANNDLFHYEVFDQLNSLYFNTTFALNWTSFTDWKANWSSEEREISPVLSGKYPSELAISNISWKGRGAWSFTDSSFKKSGTWLSLSSLNESGYYPFTVTLSDLEVYTWNSKIYSLLASDKANATNLVEDIIGANNDITAGYYVQKDHYTDASWNSFIEKLDDAAQVAYAVQSDSVGYQKACDLAGNAYNELITAFKGLEAEHDYSHHAKVETSEPLCIADGAYELTCLCGDVQTYSIPALGHNYSGEITAPKCLEGGYTTYSCTRRGCDDSYIADYTDPKGHNPVPTEGGYPATCTEDGMAVGTVCADCDMMLVDPQVIPAFGHSIAEDWEIVTDATCTEDGYKVKKCTTCDEVLEDEVIPALGHDYSVVVTPANCTEKGYSTYTCATCGDTYVDDYVDELGHKPGKVEVVEKDGTNETVVTTYCAVCGVVISTEVTEKEDFKVTGTIQSNGKTVLTGIVDSDYSATVTIPHGALINVGEVKGILTMSNVASLGVTGTKTYEKTLVTGIEKTVELDKYLPEFNSSTIVGRIDGVAYGYDLTGSNTEEVYTINAVPQDVEAVRAAWAALTNHVAVAEVSADDSYALIPGTAYMQIGTEKLSFEDVNDTLKLDNITSGSGITATIRSAVKLEEVSELEDAQTKIFLPKGTVLAVGQTVATLTDDVTIRIYGYQESPEINSILSALRDCTSTEEIIKTAVLFVSDLAVAIDGQTLTVDVEFNHIASGEWVVTEEATCTEDGKRVQYCTMCGEVVIEEAIPATGHTDGEWVNTTLPTCTESGEDTLYCAVCSEAIDTREVEALGHVEEIIPGYEPTDTQTGLTDGKKCTVCGEITVPQEIIPALGVEVSGIVETFNDGIDNDDVTTIEFYKDGEEAPVYTVTVEGSGKLEYSIASVTQGTYTVKVSKVNHATREYTVEVGTQAVTQDMKIHLIGDVNGDGKVSVIDSVLINSYLKEVGSLEDYAFVCADVNDDGDVKMVDLVRINAHVKETSSLWK